MRFIRQRAWNTCGPTAFINVLRALGKKITIRDIAKIKKLLNWDDDGIFPEAFNKGLKKYKVKYTKRIGRKRVNLKSINRFLQNRYFGVLLFAWNREDSHFILILDKRRDCYGDVEYKVVNYHDDTNHEWVSKDMIKEAIRTKWGCDYNDCPQAWWIKKRGRK